jgi:hypothetical protein
MNLSPPLHAFSDLISIHAASRRNTLCYLALRIVRVWNSFQVSDNITDILQVLTDIFQTNSYK